MRWLRRVHTYLGVFFAPLLLFFVLSGWYQTVNRDRLKGANDAHSLAQYMRVIHTDDIYPTHDRNTRVSPRVFQYLVVAMAIGLTTTIILGIMLAFRSVRNRWMIALWLVLGIGVPAGMLWLGHKSSPPPAADVSAQ